MNTQEILDKIFEYCNKHIQMLNCGGCAKVFALIAKEMLKRNIRFNLVLVNPTVHYPEISRRNPDIDTILNEVKKKGVYISACHVFFTYKRCKYNSEGLTLKRGLIIRKTEDLELLTKKLNNSYKVRKRQIWNDEYDVKQNDKLRKAIKYYFSKLD